MNKEYLFEKSILKNKLKVIEYIENFFYLSYSSLKEILDFLEELEKIKEIDALTFLKNTRLEYSNSKKQNSKNLIEYIRKYRNPIKYTAMKNLKESLSSFKGNSFKINYPENLEGDTLTIEIKLNKDSDIDKALEKLIKEKENLKRALSIIKKGE